MHFVRTRSRTDRVRLYSVYFDPIVSNNNKKEHSGAISMDLKITKKKTKKTQKRIQRARIFFISRTNICCSPTLATHVPERAFVHCRAPIDRRGIVQHCAP